LFWPYEQVRGYLRQDQNCSIIYKIVRSNVFGSFVPSSNIKQVGTNLWIGERGLTLRYLDIDISCRFTNSYSHIKEFNSLITKGIHIPAIQPNRLLYTYLKATKTQPTDEKGTEILLDLMTEFYNQLIVIFFFKLLSSCWITQPKNSPMLINLWFK